MEFEWDDEKSATVKSERGASFEELAEAATGGGLLGYTDNPRRNGEKMLIVLLKGKVWAVVTEKRKERFRFVTAYQSSKWSKKYGL